MARTPKDTKIDDKYWWDLGLLLLRASHWEARPGMLAKRADGTVWRRGELLWRQADGTSLGRGRESELVPMMYDPGTLGCLLAMVRFAQGDDKAFVMCDYQDNYYVYSHDLEGVELDTHIACSLTSEGEALVEALLTHGLRHD